MVTVAVGALDSLGEGEKKLAVADTVTLAAAAMVTVPVGCADALP